MHTSVNKLNATELLTLKMLILGATILQPVEGKPHSQKDRQNEKAEDYVSDEGTR